MPAAIHSDSCFHADSMSGRFAWKQLPEWIAAGKLYPVIGKVFPLEQARDAYTLMQEGKNYGKIVLKIS